MALPTSYLPLFNIPLSGASCCKLQRLVIEFTRTSVSISQDYKGSTRTTCATFRVRSTWFTYHLNAIGLRTSKVHDWTVFQSSPVEEVLSENAAATLLGALYGDGTIVCVNGSPCAVPWWIFEGGAELRQSIGAQPLQQ